MVLTSDRRTFTFRVYLPDAGQVQLVGTFTSWRAKAIEMTREGNGWWTVKAELASGDHDFAYLVNNSTWMADYAASGVKRNGFGGWVSQIHVPEEPVVTLPRVARATA